MALSSDQLGALASVVLLVGGLLIGWSSASVGRDQAGVMVRRGKFLGVLGPGFHFVSPFVTVGKVDLLPQTVDLDSFSAGPPGNQMNVAGQVQYRVLEPAKTWNIMSSIDMDAEDAISDATQAEMKVIGAELLPKAGLDVLQRIHSIFCNWCEAHGLEPGELRLRFGTPAGPLEFAIGNPLR